MDEDLETMTRKQLIAEAKRLRAAIREHRDSTGHALWHHPALWNLLPEKTDRCRQSRYGQSFWSKLGKFYTFAAASMSIFSSAIA